MYDRLLKLLSEAGETEGHKKIKRAAQQQKKKTAQEYLFGKPNTREQGQTTAQRRASSSFGKPSTHSTSGT